VAETASVGRGRAGVPQAMGIRSGRNRITRNMAAGSRCTSLLVHSRAEGRLNECGVVAETNRLCGEDLWSNRKSLAIYGKYGGKEAGSTARCS